MGYLSNFDPHIKEMISAAINKKNMDVHSKLNSFINDVCAEGDADTILKFSQMFDSPYDFFIYGDGLSSLLINQPNLLSLFADDLGMTKEQWEKTFDNKNNYSICIADCISKPSADGKEKSFLDKTNRIINYVIQNASKNNVKNIFSILLASLLQTGEYLSDGERLAGAKLLLDAGAEPQSDDPDYDLLTSLIEKDNKTRLTGTSAIEYVLEKSGYDKAWFSNPSRWPMLLFKAVDGGGWDKIFLVKWFAKIGLDINAVYPMDDDSVPFKYRGKTALHLAFSELEFNSSNIKMISALMSSGADPNAKDAAGHTPFEVYYGVDDAKTNKKNMEEETSNPGLYLLRMSLPYEKWKDGFIKHKQTTAEKKLWNALFNGNEESLLSAIREGASPDSPYMGYYRGMSPLIAASAIPMIPTSMTKLLLDAGANPNYRDIGGANAISAFSMAPTELEQGEKMCKLCGADDFEKSFSNYISFREYVTKEMLKKMKLLIAAGTVIDSRRPFGYPTENSLLGECRCSGTVLGILAQMLPNRFDKSTIKDNLCQHIAQAVKLLGAAGCDLNAYEPLNDIREAYRTRDDFYPFLSDKCLLLKSAYYGRLDVFQALVDAGADATANTGKTNAVSEAISGLLLNTRACGSDAFAEELKNTRNIIEFALNNGCPPIITPKIGEIKQTCKQLLNENDRHNWVYTKTLEFINEIEHKLMLENSGADRQNTADGNSYEWEY